MALDRCTFLVLIGAMINGATHEPTTSSSYGLASDGWSGPWKPFANERD